LLRIAEIPVPMKKTLSVPVKKTEENGPVTLPA
jgi:hypothetical protein